MTIQYKIKWRVIHLAKTLEVTGLNEAHCEDLAFQYADQILDQDYKINSKKERELIELIKLN